MIFLLLGLLIGVIAAGVFTFKFGFERQREVYDQLVATLEHERDEAKNEARVFRGLLFPSINKAEAGVEDARGNRSTIGTSGEVPTSAPRTSPNTAPVKRPRSRIPFRIGFNLARKQTNTPQIKTDALAEAIRHVQQVQQQNSTPEKNHA